MKSLKALIHSRRNQATNSVVNEKPTTTTEEAPNNCRLQNAREEQRLRVLNQYYTDSRRKRSRVTPQDDSEDLNIHGQAIDRRLSMATKILQQHNQPLKLYGESAQDIIARADQLNVEFKDRVYRSITAIPLSLHPNELLLAFVKTCFAIWGERIISNGEDARVYDSSQKAMVPLIKSLKGDSLPEEIRDKLHSSAIHCIRAEYKDAHAAYISLAIGDAPWPMGVTMVGIHERVGRSRIAASEITHVLDNEPVCRYIQVFKRLLSLCQSWYPTDDMSQMVLLSSSVIT